MPINIQKWVEIVINDIPRCQENKEKLIKFFTDVYTKIENYSTKESIQQNRSKSNEYQNHVFQILNDAKKEPLTGEDLVKMQQKIESLTITFSEESIFHSAPNIIKILIKEKDVSAKDYLRGCNLHEDDKELLSEFGQYTLEALIVYQLGQLYHSFELSPLIRVSTLIDRLEANVRSQALILKDRRLNKKNATAPRNQNGHNSSLKEKGSPFGSNLVNFMVQRNLITFTNKDSAPQEPLQKKSGQYYMPKPLYAMCNFDISLLPIKLNLPMISEPQAWQSCLSEGEKPRYLSELRGGYLSSPTKEIYCHNRLLSSSDLNHFFIDLSNVDHNSLCRVMNKLQNQAFQINSDWLKTLQENESLFVEYGYLMPRFLDHINLLDVSSILREFHMKDDFIKLNYSFNFLFNLICKNIQRASYEHFILKLASAYDGYHFYLPAYLDFRARIYRSGVLHFHERDLARSLILFVDQHVENIPLEHMLCATAFHYKSFDSNESACRWLDSQISCTNEYTLEWCLRLARGAKNPCQFLVNLYNFNRRNPAAGKIPITQDASASAYQIMSYFLLDEVMAKRTNLLPSADGKILDIYSFFLEELKEFMRSKLDTNLSEVVRGNLTRKIVKGIFMPIIYGKSMQSTARDLKEHLFQHITYKECFLVARVCFDFLKMKYPGMDCLIRLIRDIGWFASACNRPVYYNIPYCATVQDYMVMEPINIWVYDRVHKKRRRVTLNVSSFKRDRRKTEIATFVNFIHQRDACIAMSVVEELLDINAPIYTVHDNFLTTISHSYKIPNFYSNAFCKLGAPLSIINEFIYMNVIRHAEILDSSFGNKLYKSVFDMELLNICLKALIPDKLPKNKLEAYNLRIARIQASYGEYIHTVCRRPYIGGTECWDEHVKHWEEFEQLLQAENLRKNCVHY